MRPLSGHLFHGLLVWPLVWGKWSLTCRMMCAYSIGAPIGAGQICREKHYHSFMPLWSASAGRPKWIRVNMTCYNKKHELCSVYFSLHAFFSIKFVNFLYMDFTRVGISLLDWYVITSRQYIHFNYILCTQWVHYVHEPMVVLFLVSDSGLCRLFTIHDI